MVSLFWLLSGFVCLVFGNGRWVIPIATWLFPFFFLRFTRRQPLWRGFFIVTAAVILANSIAWWGTATSNPNSPLQFIPAGFGFLMAIIFLVERWIAPRIENGAATLVFPLLYTTFEGLVTFFSPMGSIGMLGYTQYDHLPLIQLVSITGITGATFLIAWFGSLLNWMWEQRFDWPKVRGWAAAYTAVITMVLVFGSARLVFGTSQIGVQGRTVRVAGITVTDRKIMAELDKIRKESVAAYQRRLSEIEDFAFQATHREAQAGAKIILWNEVAINIENDETEVVNRVRSLARQEEIYLVVPLYITYPSSNRLDVNKLVMIDPQGNVVLDYKKFGSAGLEGIQPGDGIIRPVDTPYGKIAAVICRDLDFPDVVRQVGRSETQILLAPSFDWYAIDPFHSRYAITRAIENGVSLVRQVADGYSVATDPYGRVLSATDHFVSQERVMVAEVPVAHLPTIYAALGDWFTELAMVALIWLIWCAVRQPPQG